MGFALAFAPNPRSVLPLLSAGQFKCLFDDFYVFGIFYHFIFWYCCFVFISLNFVLSITFTKHNYPKDNVGKKVNFS